MREITPSTARENQSQPNGSSKVGRRVFLLQAAATTALCTGCNDKKSLFTPFETFEAKVSGDAFGAFVARAFLETLSTIKEEHEKRELRENMVFVEQSLREHNESLADQMARLRKDVDRKAGLEDIRRAVEDMVYKLERATDATEKHATSTEANVEAIKKRFGYIPTTDPTPLLRVNIQGEPEAHPLTIQWANLLSKSEDHRIKLEELNRIYLPNSPEMQEAMKTLDDIKRETVQLSGMVKLALAKDLVQRTALLETRKINHPAVMDYDRKISSLTWLAGIAQKEEGGRYEGTLVVSEKLVGDQASDILAAFHLAKKKTNELVPLYRKIAYQMPIADPKLMEQSVPELKEIPKAIEGETAGFIKFAQPLYAECSALQEKLTTLLKDHSPAHSDVIKVNKQKMKLLGDIQTLNENCNALLQRSIAEYIESMQFFRPQHPMMAYLNARTIRPLSDLHAATTCFDWSNVTEREKTWENFLKKVSFVRFLRAAFLRERNYKTDHEPKANDIYANRQDWKQFVQTDQVSNNRRFAIANSALMDDADQSCFMGLARGKLAFNTNDELMDSRDVYVIVNGWEMRPVSSQSYEIRTVHPSPTSNE